MNKKERQQKQRNKDRQLQEFINTIRQDKLVEQYRTEMYKTKNETNLFSGTIINSEGKATYKRQRRLDQIALYKQALIMELARKYKTNTHIAKAALH